MCARGGRRLLISEWHFIVVKPPKNDVRENLDGSLISFHLRAQAFDLLDFAFPSDPILYLTKQPFDQRVIIYKLSPLPYPIGWLQDLAPRMSGGSSLLRKLIKKGSATLQGGIWSTPTKLPELRSSIASRCLSPAIEGIASRSSDTSGASLYSESIRRTGVGSDRLWHNWRRFDQLLRLLPSHMKEMWAGIYVHCCPEAYFTPWLPPSSSSNRHSWLTLLFHRWWSCTSLWDHYSTVINDTFLRHWCRNTVAEAGRVS